VISLVTCHAVSSAEVVLRYLGRRMRRALVMVDIAAVLVFVGVGRSVHAHGLSVAGMASTAWPFLCGLGGAWVALTLRGDDGTSVWDGVVATISTVAIGMTLRVVSGQGTAFAFVLVALGFLGAAMTGWRLLVLAHRSRRVHQTS
jgi:hypothetical protein